MPHHTLPERILLGLFELFLLLWIMGPLRIAAAATAVAIVTITVLKPVSSGQEISVDPLALDMTGKSHAELSIINHSEGWHEVQIQLLPMSDNPHECQLLYSPAFSNISPRSTQVVRVLIRHQDGQSCQVNHKLIISDTSNSRSAAIEVPLTSAPDSSTL